MITLPANDPPDGPTPPHAPWNLVPAMHSGIRAKLAWLLARPVIARIDEEPELDPDEDSDEGSDVLREMALVGKGLVTEGPATRKQSAWREDRADGTCTVRICIDYDDLWRGAEKDIKDRVEATIESAVVFLTDAQKRLLEFSPREFIELNPRPANAELLAFETEIIGGSERVITLKVAEAPPSRQRQHLHHIAIVPNLVPLERQRDALTVIEAASDDGVLAPLRALVGLCSTDSMSTAPLENDSADEKLSGETPLDEYQRACIRKAMTTPHFAVIQGPPGSGKTTVITGVIRRALALGERVLVVSPTHVAVDNVVEKLLPREEAKAEPIDAHSLPVRFASRTKKLSEQAQDYWVGKNRQFRDATISGRVKQALQSAVPIAERLYAIEKNKVPGALSVALANRQNVICGTPIGILSYEPVKQAEPGAFDLLVVDEVSKLTLPEFLAVAVKARRWVLVGDPEQLPPYNAIEENGATLDDVLPPEIELACSVGAIIERTRPAARRDERIVVVASDPVRAVEIIAAHLRAVFLDDPLSVGLLDEPGRADIVVCTNNDLGRACTTLADRMVRILVERGLAAPRPDYASGARLVEATRRAPA